MAEEVKDENTENEKLSQEDLDNIDDNDLKDDDDDDDDDDLKDDDNEATDDEASDVDSKHFSSEFKDEKAKKQAQRYNTVEDMALSNLRLRQKISKGVAPLGEDADEVEVAQFRKAFNVPEKAEDYEFPEPPEGVTEEQKQAVDKWKGLFHKHNASRDMVNDVLKMFREDTLEALEKEKANDKAFADETESLNRKEWGDNYDTNIKLANFGVSEVFGDSYEDVRHIKMSDGRFVMDHPVFIRAFSKIGREMSEGELGDSITETERDTLEEQANQFRTKAKEAQAKGRTNEANKWSQKELAVLEKLERSKGKNQ